MCVQGSTLECMAACIRGVLQGAEHNVQEGTQRLEQHVITWMCMCVRTCAVLPHNHACVHVSVHVRARVCMHAYKVHYEHELSTHGMHDQEKMCAHATLPALLAQLSPHTQMQRPFEIV